MPPRPRSPATAFYPTSDAGTFKDLLLFEERLKSNDARLKRRKRRYQLYMALMITAFLVVVVDVVLETDLSILPINLSLTYTFEWYNAHYPPPKIQWEPIQLHPLFKDGLLAVLGFTGFLFAASGMYSEKVEYANKYVPHANKALKSFNMYLNVRTQPLPSKFPFGWFSSASSHSAGSSTSPITPPGSPPPMRAQQGMRLTPPTSPLAGPLRNPIIASIPPSTNPRGELIFSSRVDKSFREGYERYRESYERKRFAPRLGEKGGITGIWNRLRYGTPPPLPDTEFAAGSVRGRVGSAPTPIGAVSRRSSPGPGLVGSGAATTGRKGSRRGLRGKAPSRTGTPLLQEIVESLNANVVDDSDGTTQGTISRPNSRGRAK